MILFSFALFASASFRVRALKFMVAPRGTRDMSGGVGSSSPSEPFLERLAGFEGSAHPGMK